MTRYTLHVPLYDNNFRPFPAEDLADIDSQLLGLFGGFTKAPGMVGAYRGENRDYHEPIDLYYIDTAEPQAQDVLLRLAQRLAQQFDQEAIYVTRQEIETFLVEPAREEIAQ